MSFLQWYTVLRGTDFSNAIGLCSYLLFPTHLFNSLTRFGSLDLAQIFPGLLILLRQSILICWRELVKPSIFNYFLPEGEGEEFCEFTPTLNGAKLLPSQVDEVWFVLWSRYAQITPSTVKDKMTPNRQQTYRKTSFSLNLLQTESIFQSKPLTFILSSS